MNLKELAEQTSARFLEQGVKIPASEIEQRLHSLVDDFKVPTEEARRSVVSYYSKLHPKQGSASSTEVIYSKIKDINAEDKWISVRVRVVQLWEPNSQSIAQVGLLGDETGTIKFTSWSNAKLPILKDGQSYSLRNVVTKSWQGRFSISLNKASEIAPLDEEVVVGRAEEEISGTIIDVQSGSGLIKRCPECSRVVVKGYCAEHGNVSGVYDLRIKGVLDNGEIVTDVLFNRELTERLTGITLAEAKEMAMEALDQNVVADSMKAVIIGRFYLVRGNKTPRWLLITDFKETPQITEGDISAVLARAQELL
ncbi:MAG: replication factor A [Euryarchaeota archaeon]|nr:replication factor A [Euryarchaeota archaeon]